MKGYSWILVVVAIGIVAFIIWKSKQPKKITVMFNGQTKTVPESQIDPNVNVKSTD